MINLKRPELGVAALLLLAVLGCSNPVNPSDDGDLSPTATPSPEPSATPTEAPSSTPSGEPTASPTPDSSVEPSSTPTAAPSGEPTPSPTATSAATPTPTASPPVSSATPSPTPDPTETPSPTPTATPSGEPTPSPAATPVFGFESGIHGTAPGTENSITPTVVNAVISDEQARSGNNSAKLSDVESSTVGSFRATGTPSVSGTFKVSIYLPSDIDGTVYVDLWAGGNAQANNLVSDIVFAISDKTLRYRQGTSQRTFLMSDGSTSLKWLGDAWNDLVFTWTEVNDGNVVRIALNGENAKTSTADSVAGSTPVFDIPTFLTGKTPDRVEIKYGNSGSAFTKSIYIDDLSFF